MPKFTDFMLKNLPIPAQGQVTYKDDLSPLSVRISQGGSRTFIVTLDGTGRRHTIGKYGDITLVQAREAARTLRAEKTLGRILPRVVSLSDTRQEYLDGLDIRNNTLAYYKRNLERLRGLKLQDITPRDINKILDDLGHTSRAQALRTYSAFFNWCIRRHYLDNSPCARMVAPQSTSRDRVLTDEELKAVWNAAGQIDGHFGTIVKLLILTGQRRGEVAGLQSSWVEDDTITLPKEVAKNGREHTFPIGPLAGSILVASRTKSGFLFSARGYETSPFNGWSKSKAVIDELSGVADWTLHDLRRTFATRLAEIGVAPHVVERLLNHVTGSLSPIALVYNKAKYLDEMREAVEKWEAHLEELLN